MTTTLTELRSVPAAGILIAAAPADAARELTLALNHACGIFSDEAPAERAEVRRERALAALDFLRGYARAAGDFGQLNGEQLADLGAWRLAVGDAWASHA